MSPGFQLFGMQVVHTNEQMVPLTAKTCRARDRCPPKLSLKGTLNGRLTSNSTANSYFRRLWMYQHFPNHLEGNQKGKKKGKQNYIYILQETLTPPLPHSGCVEPFQIQRASHATASHKVVFLQRNLNQAGLDKEPRLKGLA